jgi:hypothetical protein
MSKLLSNASTNPKTAKQLDTFKIEGVIQHMTPDRLADGKRTVCPDSTPGCRATCLNTSGRSQVKGDLTKGNLEMYMIHRSRIGKTLSWLNNKQAYIGKLCKELTNLENRAERKGYAAVARLNGTSDIPWESWIPMSGFDIQFYDYTKSYKRMKRFLNLKLPSNYDLTFSYSEKTTQRQVNNIICKGGNVAVVFRKEMPDYFYGHKVITGMDHDFRYKDKKGYIVGLIARGRAKKDDTGFVVDV